MIARGGGRDAFTGIGNRLPFGLCDRSPQTPEPPSKNRGPRTRLRNHVDRSPFSNGYSVEPGKAYPAKFPPRQKLLYGDDHGGGSAAKRVGGIESVGSGG